AKIFQENVRPGDELAEDSAATLVLEVEHHAALIRVHPEVDRSLAAHGTVPVAHHVAARRLDLDDLRAEVGQVAQPQWTADRYPQRDDAHTIERKGRRGGPLPTQSPRKGHNPPHNLLSLSRTPLRSPRWSRPRGPCGHWRSAAEAAGACGHARSRPRRVSHLPAGGSLSTPIIPVWGFW